MKTISIIVLTSSCMLRSRIQKIAYVIINRHGFDAWNGKHYRIGVTVYNALGQIIRQYGCMNETSLLALRDTVTDKTIAIALYNACTTREKWFSYYVPSYANNRHMIDKYISAFEKLTSCFFRHVNGNSVLNGYWGYVDNLAIYILTKLY